MMGGVKKSRVSGRGLALAAAIATWVLLGPTLVPGAGPVGAAVPPAGGPTADTFKQLSLFADALEAVKHDYVEPVTDEQLIEAAISGMLSSLDPHSSFMNAKAFKDMQVQTSGEFGGLGIEVSADPSGFIRVVSPIDDTPGSRAGLKANDMIMALDGEPVNNLTLQEAVEKMRGAPDTKVTLTIRRGTDPVFDVHLTRAKIHITAVKSRIERDTIAYIRLSSFTRSSGAEVAEAFNKLKKQSGDKLTGIILDLRSNPGGLLDQAVEISNIFIDHGEIVSTRGRRPDDIQRYNAHPGADITKNLPVVVLIDGGSASASEIVAGALQDHHRAVILGTRSFGKGSVQTIKPIGSDSALRLTTARYFTPSGRSIQAKGIDPDIVVEPAKGPDHGAVGDRLREADLKGALKNPDQDKTATANPPAKDATGKDVGKEPVKDPGKDPAAKDPAKDQSTPAATPAGTKDNKDDGALGGTAVDPSVLGTKDDYQLNRALDLIKGAAIFTSRPVD